MTGRELASTIPPSCTQSGATRLAGSATGSRMRRVAWAIAAVILAAACREGDPLRDASETKISDRPAREAPGSPPPAVSCITAPVTESALLREVSGVLPEDVRRMPGRNEGYAPGMLIDAVVADDGRVLALDRMLQRVWVFDSDLKLTESWGRKGVGPHELHTAAALAFDPRDGTVVLAETGPPGLARFTMDGKLVNRVQVRSTPGDLVVAEDGGLVVSHPVRRPRLESWAEGEWPLIISYGPGLEPKDTLLTVSTDDLGERPFITFAIEPRIGRPQGGRVPVLFPYTNDLVTIDHSGGDQRRAQGCVPESLEEYYQARLGTPGGGAVLLATDVWLGPDGEVLVISPVQTADGDYHLDRYDPDLRPRSTMRLPARAVRLPEEIRLIDGGRSWLVFSRTGTIAIVAPRPVNGSS